MYDELSLKAASNATARLVNGRWAECFERICTSLKAVGYRNRADGAEALLKRLKRARPSTYYHSVRVARLTRLTGRAIGFDDYQLKQLSYAATLHDVGKVLVPESVLNRPCKLNRTEATLMHMHPNLGVLVTSYFGLPVELQTRIQHHHEHWDGTGYPHKLGGEEIPLMARIVQVADAYDAMITLRPYRAPRTHEAAVTELRRQTGKQFDSCVVEAFLDTFSAQHCN